MKIWIRKVFVVLVAIMTLGIYIPTSYIDTETAKNSEVSPKENLEKEIFSFSESQDSNNSDDSNSKNSLDSSLTNEEYIHIITAEAREQTVSKLGPKIMNQVEDEMLTTVLPGMESVIAELFHQQEDETVPYYEIAEQPSAGYGEKIFNLYDHNKKIEVARFHVRRDKRPGEGYWFNFHYHLNEDGFEAHHTIGDVYWSKNTPPKWMA